jgi:hypothetical protein
MNHSPESIDALETISEFNKAELFLLKVVNENIVHGSLELKIVKSNYSLADKRKLTAAIKSWIDKKLIRRLHREHYMISPYFFTPLKNIHEDMLMAWEDQWKD